MQKVMIDAFSKEKKSKRAVTIYFNEDKTSFQRIQPGELFDNNYLELVEHITNSDNKRGIRNYYQFEIDPE